MPNHDERATPSDLAPDSYREAGKLFALQTLCGAAVAGVMALLKVDATGGLAAVGTIAGAMTHGMRREMKSPGSLPSPARRRLAARAALFQMVVLPGLVAFLLIGHEDSGAKLDVGFVAVIAGVTLFALVLTFLTTWWGLKSGVRNAETMRARGRPSAKH